MILFTISNTFAAKLFATKLSKMSCLFSHSLLNILAHLPPQYNCFEKCRGSWKNWRPGISYSNPIPVLIPVCEIANSGTGREWKKSIPTIWEREGNEKNILIIREWEGNEKKLSQNSGVGSECSFRQRMGAKSNFPIFWLLVYHENIKWYLMFHKYWKKVFGPTQPGGFEKFKVSATSRP